MATARSTPLPRRKLADRIIYYHGVASFTFGMVYPFSAVYLAGLPAIGTTGVAIFFGVSGVANLVVTLLLAGRLIRLPTMALGVCGTALSLVGYALVPLATENILVTVIAVAIGAGRAAFLAAVIPMLNNLIHESERRRVFARRYQVLNGTLALGALVAGGVTAAFGRGALPYLFVVAAVGFLPITILQLRARDMVSDVPVDREGTEPEQEVAPARTMALFKMCAVVVLFQFGAYLVGFSQFESTVPLAADRLLGTGLVWISVMLGTNVVVIVLCQDLVTKLLEKRSVLVGLRITMAFWLAGYIAVAICSLGSGVVPIMGLLIFAALLGIGECAYSCTYHPWLISIVPDSELTRAGALANSAMGVGMFAGPAIGTLLVGTGNVTLVWLCLACGTVVMGLMVRQGRTVPVRS